MQRSSWTGLAVALGIAAVLSSSSCSSDSGKGGGAFPFSGPSCPSSCGSCVQSHCSSDEQCLASQCADYFKCTCACNPGDGACLGACSAHDSLECQGCRNYCFGVQCGQCAGSNPDGGSGADGASNPIAEGGPAGVFPFTGPSCPTACSQCVQDNCASQGSCYVSDCSDFLTCSCACAAGDLTCAVGCASAMTSACMTCRSTADVCLNQNCSMCAGDAGLDAGISFTSDAGGCEQLTTCCFGLPNPSDQNSCASVALTQDPVACQQALSGYEDGGLCP
jgi:hypothetical protein